MHRLLEICVDDAEGVRAASEGGANRIELCSALGVGGLTPSVGLTAFAATVGVAVRVMIRPRAGNFTFDASDERVMHEDIVRLLALGVEGVVLGASTADGRLDGEMLSRLINVARDSGARGLTLHRAIDLAPNLEEAVDEAVSLGFDTILSSGGFLTAPEGAAALAKMQKRAAESLTIMAGSGVNAQNVAALVKATGVRAVHASARNQARARDEKLIAFGFSPPAEKFASGASVRALREALDRTP